uniref:Uncharacterized protein n=1 Tax=Leptobrachium leishanense TaxID=445787 RepID=A0A8C5P8N9_9ANUR
MLRSWGSSGGPRIQHRAPALLLAGMFLRVGLRLWRIPTITRPVWCQHGRGQQLPNVTWTWRHNHHQHHRWPGKRIRRFLSLVRLCSIVSAWSRKSTSGSTACPSCVPYCSSLHNIPRPLVMCQTPTSHLICMVLMTPKSLIMRICKLFSFYFIYLLLFYVNFTVYISSGGMATLPSHVGNPAVYSASTTGPS